jgi:hypothetical protein
MIYLFNSAFNPTYLENVYRLIGLPEYSRVDLRYTEGVNAPEVETDEKMINSNCIVCFIDRFTGNYLYIPFRKGRIRSIKREQRRVFYTVELLEYCHSTSSLSDLTRTIQRSVPLAPRLTNNDTKYYKDGLYCVEGPDPDQLIVTETDSWTKAVDQIYKTGAFLIPVPALFLATIERDGGKPSGTESGLDLHANTEYLLSVHYRFPPDRNDGGRRRILVKMGSEINRELSIGSVSDKLTVPFNLPPLNFSAAAITVETIVEERGSTGGETRYTGAIPFRTRAWRSNILLFGLLALVSFLDEFFKVGFDLTNTTSWLSTFFQFLKFAIVIWAVFTYRGKLKIPGL